MLSCPCLQRNIIWDKSSGKNFWPLSHVNPRGKEWRTREQTKGLPAWGFKEKRKHLHACVPTDQRVVLALPGIRHIQESINKELPWAENWVLMLCPEAGRSKACTHRSGPGKGFVKIRVMCEKWADSEKWPSVNFIFVVVVIKVSHYADIFYF